MANSSQSATFLFESRLQAAIEGDADARYQIGLAYSCGSLGLGIDLVKAHMWLNLAGVAGHDEAPHCRAEIAEEMTAREIADAQRDARAWLRQHGQMPGSSDLRAAA